MIGKLPNYQIKTKSPYKNKEEDIMVTLLSLLCEKFSKLIGCSFGEAILVTQLFTEIPSQVGETKIHLSGGWWRSIVWTPRNKPVVRDSALSLLIATLWTKTRPSWSNSVVTTDAHCTLDQYTCRLLPYPLCCRSLNPLHQCMLFNEV